MCTTIPETLGNSSVAQSRLEAADALKYIAVIVGIVVLLILLLQLAVSAWDALSSWQKFCISAGWLSLLLSWKSTGRR